MLGVSKSENKDELPVISLFSGAGGLDIGLENVGFRIKVGVEVDHDCCETLRLNRRGRRVIEDDIRNVSTQRILNEADLDYGKAFLVCGGPPCQPFSKSAFWNEKRQGLKDPRASLLHEFVRVVQEAKPLAYIMENVFGLAYKTSRPLLIRILQELENAGYTTNYSVINAADFGVPQKRERLFIIGARNGLKLSFPESTHCARSSLDIYLGRQKPYVTAGDAIGDLDDNTVRENEEVSGKWGHLLPEIPPGDNYLYFTEKRGHPTPIFKWRSKYWSFLLKLSPNKPSWTIQAQPGPYVGPFHWNNRRLRILEIKRLQTFPDEYHIFGDRRSVQRQLGDAVPPLLTQKLGESIKKQLLSKSKTIQIQQTI
jgi:DNA (cytosine-5)-methyltransferase 1